MQFRSDISKHSKFKKAVCQLTQLNLVHVSNSRNGCMYAVH